MMRVNNVIQVSFYAQYISKNFFFYGNGSCYIAIMFCVTQILDDYFIGPEHWQVHTGSFTWSFFIIIKD